MKPFFFMGLIFFLLLTRSVHASLKINEIYPAPSGDDTEWVEIYNDGDTTVDLTGYKITDAKDTTLTFETYTASPSSYLLATSTNVLNNSGDSVVLKNASGEVIDSVTYSDSFSSDKSFIRCNDGWIQTAVISKRDSNVASCVIPTATQIPEQMTDTPTNSPISSTPRYDRIYISEAMVNPEEENEWIELYNDNDFAVSLKQWYIDDIENAGSSPKQFSIDIGAKSYAVYELPSSVFNNDTDTVRLLDENNSVKDFFAYYSSVNGLTIGKTNPAEKSVCITNPTRGYANGACVEISATSASSTPTPTSKMTPTISPTRTVPTSTSAVGIIITRAPTKKLIRPTVHLPEYLYDPNKQPAINVKNETKGQVLGMKTMVKDPQKQNAESWKILALVGGTISFLTIIKIFFRMRHTI